MPCGDGTRPLGVEPMTGRGLGFCILRVEGTKRSGLKGFAGLEGRGRCMDDKKTPRAERRWLCQEETERVPWGWGQ